jgi:hypothetical protein
MTGVELGPTTSHVAPSNGNQSPMLHEIHLNVKATVKLGLDLQSYATQSVGNKACVCVCAFKVDPVSVYTTV